jgi:2-polyprenyl-3-methyl-5-hydroxy-6-metoxy-1,4-benzoquinol methylase
MNTCIVCGGHEFIPVFSGTLKKCAQCGFATANVDFSPELLQKIYSVNYFLGEEYLDYLHDKKTIQLNFHKRINTIKKVVSGKLPLTNCLEIGCAYGFFGEILKNNWNTEYLGMDVVPEAVQFGKTQLNLNLKTGDYLQEAAPLKPYSDVFMWDVIEHLQYPEKFLQKAFKELAHDGRIYITTGDFSSLLARIQGKNWRMIHPPSHLHYFTKSSLIRLLKSNGFSIMKVNYLPVYRSVRQIFYSLFLLNKPEGKLNRLIEKIPAGLNVSLNTFDIVFIIAEKKAD